jgi:hypothetical protein
VIVRSRQPVMWAARSLKDQSPIGPGSSIQAWSIFETSRCHCSRSSSMRARTSALVLVLLIDDVPSVFTMIGPSPRYEG